MGQKQRIGKKNFKLGEEMILLFSLPFFLVTFFTFNHSDDYQYIHLLNLKASFSPFLSVVTDITGGHAEGGHFAPVYNLINLTTTNPQVFHFFVVLCHALTAVVIYKIARLKGDRLFAIIAAFLFSINVLCGFKSLTWNCFHSHVTNTLTGTLSLYLLFRGRMGWSCFFYLLTILNYESGFIFLPILLFYAYREKMGRGVALALLLCSLAYPVGAYLKTGNPNPLSYRFKQEKTLQGYVFRGAELTAKSLGVSYPLVKTHSDLKQITKLEGIDKLHLYFLAFISGLGVWNFILRGSEFTIPFLLMLLLSVLVFYRTDIANSLNVFGSLLMAQVVRPKQSLIWLFIIFFWLTLKDLDLAYLRNFGKKDLTTAQLMYDNMNRYGYLKDGVVFKDFGWGVGSGDLLAYNALTHKDNFLKTDLPKIYRDKSLLEFCDYFRWKGKDL